MPITAQTPVNSSTANGVTTVFAYTFLIYDEDDLLVEVDGVEQTSGYTVSGVGVAGGGNVTFSVAPTNGAIVTRARNMDVARAIDYQEGGGFEAATVDEDADRGIMIAQQINLIAKRAFKAPRSVSADQVLSEDDWANRAGAALAFDDSGNLTVTASYAEEAAAAAASAVAAAASASAAAVSAASAAAVLANAVLTTGNQTIGGNKTFSNALTAAGLNSSAEINVTGVLTAHAASKLALQQRTSAISRITAYGADDSTPGVLEIDATSSAGGTGGTKVTVSSTGVLISALTLTTPLAAAQGGTGLTGAVVGTGASVVTGDAVVTYTPTLNFAGGTTGITYTSRYGRYSKIGPRIIGNAQYTMSSKGSSTGAANIDLPVAVKAGISINAPGYFAQLQNFGAGISSVYAPCVAGTSVAPMTKFSAGTGATILDSDFTNTTTFDYGYNYEY